MQPEHVIVESDHLALAGDLTLPSHGLTLPTNPAGLVVFAHGSGSSRMSPRNRHVAEALVIDGFATLLFDLLTPREEIAEQHTHHLRFDIDLLARRLAGALAWVMEQPSLAALPIGLFGASTGAAAALIAATRMPVGAVVCRGGRPDLAAVALPKVTCPTLLIVGGDDRDVLALNRDALRRLSAAKAALHVVPQAGHLFEEPGTLDEVTAVAARWFHDHLIPPAGRRAAVMA